MTGIEAFASPCAHKRIHSTLRKLRDELLSPEHGEDFAVHLQAIRRHQFAAGDITMMGKCVDNWPKAGINFCRSRLLFSLPGWHSSSSQPDICPERPIVCAKVLTKSQLWRAWLRCS